MKMLLRGCAIATLLFVVAPAAGEDPAPSATGSARITAELADRVIDDVVPLVAALRGLEFRAAVPVDVIDDATARRHLLERADRLDLADQVTTTETLYGLLGLIGPDDDLLELFLGALDEQAGGFYDPAEKRFYLLDDMPAAAIEVLTAHELTHALEDQHYDLDGRILEVIDDDDRLFARSAVHEGSATLVMTVYAARAILSGSLDPAALAEYEEAFGQGAALAALPPVLLRQLLGPYVLGAGFLARGDPTRILQGGFPVADANRAFADPPASSEQILHPEKYWDERDDPVPLDLAGVGARLGRRWTRVGAGTLGELSLGVLTGAATPTDPVVLMAEGAAAWTDPATSGWGGDRWELWERGRKTVLLVLTSWDSVSDAEEFARAVAGRDDLRVRHAAERVAIVAGASRKRSEPLLEALLGSGRSGAPGR